MSNEYEPEYEPEEHFLDNWIGTIIHDKSIENKTPEQLREKFREKWGLIIAILRLQEGETPRDLIDKGALYDRPVREIYNVVADYPDVRERKQEKMIEAGARDRVTEHIHFVEEALIAGYRIEAVIPRDESSPLYRRILRAEPRQ